MNKKISKVNPRWGSTFRQKLFDLSEGITET